MLLLPADTPGAAWRASLGGLVALFASFGIVNSFGVLIPPMSEDLDADPASLSWLLSLALLVAFALAPVTGKLADRFGPRPLLLASGIFVLGGLLGTSLINGPAAGYVTFGAGVGTGVACAYVPALAGVGGWFGERRGLGLGLAAAGVGLGTAVLPPVTAALADGVGWRTTARVLGFGGMTLLVVGALLMARPPAHRDAAVAVVALDRTRTLVRLTVATFVLAFLFAMTFAFLPSSARGDGASELSAALLVGILGGVATIAQVGFGFLGDRTGHVRSFRIAVSLVAGSFVFWLLAGGYLLYVAFAVVMGLGFGGFVTLLPAAIASLLGPGSLGSALGRLYVAQAVGGLLVPLAGQLADSLGTLTPVLAGVLACGVVAVLSLRGLHDPRSPIPISPG